MSVAVLNDETADAVRPPGCKMIADRRAEVVDEQEKAIEAERRDKRLDRVGEVLERVFVLVGGWSGGEAETGQIRRNDIGCLGQRLDDVAIHVRGARKSMQQQDSRSVGVAGVSVEDVQALDAHRLVAGLVAVAPHIPSPVSSQRARRASQASKPDSCLIEVARLG
jgi:hypothetical protein